MIGEKIHQYKILKKIGAGGQGTVYKALDTKLDRTAVIKVLPPELTAKTANLARFEREAKLCSQLDHPNICTIYDYNEDDGTFYIAMQHVVGKNIREFVAGRALELTTALRIEIQVCDALAYAHSKSIIHRDIKAHNIMVNRDGQVKILDFGLAKLLIDEPTESGDKQADITEVGVPYGTATYAAPEQARGEKTDHRADIFSSGVLLYEMLTGVWAFQGKTPIDVRYQVLYGTPPPLSEMRDEALPPILHEIIDKALAKNPDDRYQDISEMGKDLRWVLQEVSGVAQIQTDAFSPQHLDTANPVKRAWNWVTDKSDLGESNSSDRATKSYAPDITPSAGGTEKKAIAILPFTNLSKNPATEFYEFSLADAVITELAQLHTLIVRPSSVIAKYQGKEVDAYKVGRELRVHAVLTASFIVAGDRMRVTAQLLDVVSGEILWSDRIDAEEEDIFALQDVIGQHILEGLQMELSDEEQEVLGRLPTENAEAYEEYLRGRDNLGRFAFRAASAEDCDVAIANFKRATVFDPKFTLAYSGLGACFLSRVTHGIGGAGDYDLAEEAFENALKFDPTVSEARILMVMVHLARGEKSTARAKVKTLHEEFPNEARTYNIKGIVHRLDGEYDESLKSFEKLARLNPAAKAISNFQFARIFIYKGEYEKALEELDKAAKAEPNYLMISIYRSYALFYKGEIDKAIQIIQDTIEKNPGKEGIRPMLAIYFAHQGRHDEARAQLTPEALDISYVDYDRSYSCCSAYALLGEKEKALDWLERAIKLGNENKPWFENDKTLESIRGEERFKSIIKRIVR